MAISSTTPIEIDLTLSNAQHRSSHPGPLKKPRVPEKKRKAEAIFAEGPRHLRWEDLGPRVIKRLGDGCNASAG